MLYEVITKKWKKYPELIKQSFLEIFYSEQKKQLADYVNDYETNWDVRPNQIFAASLPYSMLSKDQIKVVTDRNNFV